MNLKSVRYLDQALSSLCAVDPALSTAHPGAGFLESSLVPSFSVLINSSDLGFVPLMSEL